MEERILLAVDGSPASKRALEYVTSMVGWETAERYLHLVHVLPPVPARVDRSGRPRSGKDEEEARELLTRMRRLACQAGLAAERVDVGLLYLRPDLSLVEGLIQVARDQSCGTIIVGRSSLPWYRELFHHHPADELVHQAHGFTVWIVE